MHNIKIILINSFCILCKKIKYIHEEKIYTQIKTINVHFHFSFFISFFQSTIFKYVRMNRRKLKQKMK